MDYLRFSAEKYGESSYRPTFDERPAEYGIIVSNPNNVDEKMVIVSAFAIDGGAAAKKAGTTRFRSVRCRAILHRFSLYRGAGKEPVRIETSSGADAEHREESPDG